MLRMCTARDRCVVSVLNAAAQHVPLERRTMLSEDTDAESAVQTAQTALVALDGVVSLATQPFNAASHLSEALKALHHASEVAEFCESICKDMIATACSRAPILCVLLTLGDLYPQDHQQLNRALHASLKLALEAVETTSHSIYAYMRGNTVTRLMYAQSTRTKIEEQRTYLKSRFDDIQAHVQYATYLQGRQAQERVGETVRSVEQLRREMEALQNLERGDADTVRATANAVADRKKASGQKIHAFESVSCVSVSPDGRLFAAGGQSTRGNVTLFEAAAGSKIRALTGHASFVTNVSWSPDGCNLATCSHDKTAAIWDAQSGERVVELEGHTWWVNSVAWSPSGRQLATASHDKTCMLWDAESGGNTHVLVGHSGWVHSVAWSADGIKIATASEDKTAALWDAATGARLSVLKGHSEWVKGIAWSPDACMLATASGDDTAAIWDVATGHRMHVLQGHANWVSSVSWSPDGRMIATGSDDDTAALWRVATAARVRVLKGHGGLVNCTAWSPCGRNLYTASQDGSVHIYCVREFS